MSMASFALPKLIAVYLRLLKHTRIIVVNIFCTILNYRSTLKRTEAFPVLRFLYVVLYVVFGEMPRKDIDKHVHIM